MKVNVCLLINAYKGCGVVKSDRLCQEVAGETIKHDKNWKVNMKHHNDKIYHHGDLV